MKLKTALAAAFVSGMYVFSVFAGAESIRQAVELCIKSLVPGIFCSVIFSLFLAKSGLWTYFGGSALLLTGLLCGFPSGAIMASGLYERGEISKKQAERICFLYSLPSPAFVIAVAGGEIYGSLFMGVMLYVVLLLSLLVCDMIFYPKTENSAPEKKCRALLPSLVDAVSESGEKCLTICSFVMFFYVLGSAVTKLPLIDKLFKALVLSLIEMTRAVKACSALTPNAAFIMTSFALAFSGISVGAQVGFYALKGGISMRGYFEKRLVFAAVAVLLSSALLYLPAPVFAVFGGLIIFCFALKRKYLQKGGKNKKDSENTSYKGFVYKSSDKAKGEA